MGKGLDGAVSVCYNPSIIIILRKGQALVTLQGSGTIYYYYYYPLRAHRPALSDSG